MNAHSAQQLIALTPLSRPDLSLASALLGSEVSVCLDLSCGPEAGSQALQRACTQGSAGQTLSIRVSKASGWRPEAFSALGVPPSSIQSLMIPSAERHQGWARLDLPLWLEVFSPTELVEVMGELKRGELKVKGLVLTGAEAAGRCGEVGGFLLLQRALSEREALSSSEGRPLLALRGGVSVATGAAALSLGCDRLVLDERWLGCTHIEVPSALQSLLPRLESTHGARSEAVDGPQRQLKHPLWSAEGTPLSADHPWVTAPRGLHPVDSLRAFCEALNAHSAQLSQACDAPLKVAQGPMTRVSDLPAFAQAVAEAGALPFLALSLLRPEQAKALLEETKEALADQPWGVGILGFAPPELRDAHLALIRDIKPSAVLIAGGRPSLSRALEEEGIPTYLHAPSPELLKGFIKAGARRFVFEGSECGGHIGPRTSLNLWAAQLEAINELLSAGELDDPSSLELWFAGGVHDDRSGAFIRALCAPLSAQGAQIGVVMGTAYLFTREAVKTGAIVMEYQRVALELTETSTLHTAPGHATRCAPTPFVQDFERTKATLIAEGVEPRARWAQLEQLNVGRLRVASKGIERGPDGLTERSLAEQRARGMYMIGEVATLRREVTTMSALHHEVTDGSARLLKNRINTQKSALMSSEPSTLPSPQPVQSDEIAIVGISSVFPSAEGLEAYWSLILDKGDAVTEVPDERWPKDIYYDPEAPAGERSASKWGAFLAPVALDPMRYGLPPTTLTAVEPVQLLALEVSARALEDAGYAALPGEAGRTFNRERAGVIFGAEAGTDLANAYSLRGSLPQWVGPLPPHLDERLPRLTEDSFAGVLANVISGRIANRFDLGGANFTVDAACAASLAALDAAVKELKFGGADLMICGGADLHNSVNDYLMFSSVHALSKTGRCKTFDHEADGITLGEGVAAIVLKRLSDAQRDGDRVYAVIEGIGASSDGKSFGLTAPRKEGQQRAVERAYQRAQVDPKQIGLVEAHGTGTVVGDRTELEALTALYQASQVPPRSVALGSVKSQIGHTKCAAGMAGLVKVALSIYRRTLPPTLHVTEPNKAYDPASSPFNLYAEPQPWLSQARWGAVSAFGFGGTNFHAALRSATQLSAPRFLREAWRSEPLVLLAETPAELQERAGRWAEGLRERATHEERGAAARPAELRDWAYSLWSDGASSRSATPNTAPCGAVLLASSFEEAARSLAWLAQGESAPPEGVRLTSSWGLNGEVTSTPQRDPKQVAALFPGQGAQRVGMMSELALTFGQVSDRWLEHPRWSQVICPPPALNSEEKKKQSVALTDTRNAQPALGLCDLAMWDLAHGLGLEATHLAGHSYGELVALTVAGVIPADRLAPISAARGEAILGAARGGDPGKMAAMRAGADELKVALDTLKDSDPRLEGVVIANLNAPKQSVISGPSEAIDLAVEGLKSHKLRGRVIPVACAFHSGVVASGGARFAEALSAEPLRPLHEGSRYIVWSNEQASPYPALSAEEVGARLSAHIASPVRFVEQVEAMYEAGARLFVEVGPGRILSKLVSDILGERPHEVVSLAPERGDTEELLRGLSALSALGVPIQWGQLFEGRASARPLEELTLAHPAKLLWWVNGQRAWPARGDLTRGLRPPLTPLGWVSDEERVHLTPQSTTLYSDAPQELTPLMSQPTPPPLPLGDGAPMSPELSGALSAYFTNMRALAESQQQVMLALMGQSAPALTARPAPVRYEQPTETSNEADEWWRGVTSTAQAPVSEPARPLAEVTPAKSSSAPHVKRDSTRAPNKTPAVSAVRDIGALLVGLVSERTGYPPEMLDHGLDLEADLGVDSIKRIEILGALGERLGLAQDGAGEEMVEELALMKSLGEMIHWLQSKLAEPKEEVVTPAGELELSAQAQALSDEDGTRSPKAEGERLPRATRAWVDAPLSLSQPTSEAPCALGELLGSLKAGRHRWEPSSPLRASALQLPEQSTHQLLWLSQPAERWDTLPNHALLSALLKLVQEEWSTSPPECFTVACEWPTDAPSSLALGALTGFLKTLWRERPAVSIKLVYLEPEGQDLTPLLYAELCEQHVTRAEGVSAPSVIRLSPSARLTERYVDSIAPTSALTQHKPEAGALLVTGGAKGITALCLTGLPLQGQALLLCGRSASPKRLSALWRAHQEALNELNWRDAERALRKALMTSLPTLDRAELNALLREGRSREELTQSLHQLKALGAEPVYLSVDVSDLEALKQAIHKGLERLRSALSRPTLSVTAVIHGAGVIEDKKLEDKTQESFERVWRVKVEGARSLLTALPDVRRWVMFSSVSSALGNQGQLDYASANAALDALCVTLRAHGQHATSIQWGPWGGAGMVTDVLARYYKRAGIKLIEPEGGVRAFQEEWTAMSASLPPQHDPISLRSWPFER